MTLQEHLRRAERAWDKHHRSVEAAGLTSTQRSQVRESLRTDAVRFAPLYPLIEARRGRPV